MQSFSSSVFFCLNKALFLNISRSTFFESIWWFHYFWISTWNRITIVCVVLFFIFGWDHDDDLIVLITNEYFVLLLVVCLWYFIMILANRCQSFLMYFFSHQVCAELVLSACVFGISMNPKYGISMEFISMHTIYKICGFVFSLHLLSFIHSVVSVFVRVFFSFIFFVSWG